MRTRTGCRALGVRTVQAERALRFYDDMAQRRIEPDMVTYEALLKVVVPESTRSTREYPKCPVGPVSTHVLLGAVRTRTGFSTLPLIVSKCTEPAPTGPIKP